MRVPFVIFSLFFAGLCIQFTTLVFEKSSWKAVAGFLGSVTIFVIFLIAVSVGNIKLLSNSEIILLWLWTLTGITVKLLAFWRDGLRSVEDLFSAVLYGLFFGPLQILYEARRRR